MASGSQQQMPGVAIYHNSSADVSANQPNPSSQQSQDSRYQSEMKVLIEHELKGATYVVDLTNDEGILHADPGTVQAVIDSLGSTFQTLTSENVSSEAVPRLPEDGFRYEPDSYEPLAHLLNKIIQAVRQFVPQSQLNGLRFHPFNKEVKETYGSHKPLKPDLVGIIGELPNGAGEADEEPAKKPSLSWEQVEVNLESKDSIRDMVRQSGSYARCCVLCNKRRFFTLGMGFHYKKVEAYVFSFHRGGLSSSRPLRLTTPEGFNGLVRHMVGILSFKDEAAYGLDPTRFKDIFYINNRYYKIVGILYERGTLRGRSTTVYSLHGMYRCRL
jgi:hypothetical protein